jgi:hypothetical protein
MPRVENGCKQVKLVMREIAVRRGKGGKIRITMLLRPLMWQLRTHLQRVRIIHEQDLADGLGEVYLPRALERK